MTEVITDEFKADAITMSEAPIEALEQALQAKKSGDIGYFESFPKSDIIRNSSIELLEYVIKNYDLLVSIPRDWFRLQTNVLQSLPE